MKSEYRRVNEERRGWEHETKTGYSTKQSLQRTTGIDLLKNKRGKK